MRLKNLTELADLLRGLDNNSPRRKTGFDMNKSAYCIGGWVQYLNKHTRDLELDRAVATICPPDMSSHEIYNLCYPRGIGNPAWKATPQQAAKAVEILRDTGKCDWEEVMK